MADARLSLVDMALEVVVLPVADVERSIRFYAGLGWRLDADIASGDAFRLVQFTPPGSGCSIHFGRGITDAVPGSGAGLYLVVADIGVARDELLRRGVDVSNVFHRSAGSEGVDGVDPGHRSYASFVSFEDPDGNAWLVQEVTARLPGRVSTETTSFRSLTELAEALRRAAAAHGEQVERTAHPHAAWPEWYANYVVREQRGEPLPT